MRVKVKDYAAAERISEVAAYKRLKRCGITPDGGWIDDQEVSRKWSAVKDEAQQRQRLPPGARKPATAESIQTLSTFNDARAKREWVRLEREALDLAKIRNRLVPIDQVETAAFDRARAEREALQNWPARIAPLLAAELGVDDRKLFNLLEREVRAFLENRSGGPLLASVDDDERKSA